MISLNFPLDQKEILDLKIGDRILINGTIFTARDRAHQFLMEHHLGNIDNSIIYHCGPLIKDDLVISAGPTTSSRLNRYTPELIRKYGIKAIIGKGGMDDAVINSLMGKAVYLSAIGGAGITYAKTMRIKNAYNLEFGMSEAIWEFEVKDFPAIVTMDSRGNSLYKQIYKKSEAIFRNQLL